MIILILLRKVQFGQSLIYKGTSSMLSSTATSPAQRMMLRITYRPIIHMSPIVLSVGSSNLGWNLELEHLHMASMYDLVFLTTWWLSFKGEGEPGGSCYHLLRPSLSNQAVLLLLHSIH